MEMALYCQKDNSVDNMLRQVFVVYKLSIGYVNVASYIQKELETQHRKVFMAQVMLRPRAFEMLLYFREPIFWKDCM